MPDRQLLLRQQRQGFGGGNATRQTNPQYSRSRSGKDSIEIAARFWAKSVIMEDAAESAIRGIFSRISRAGMDLWPHQRANPFLGFGSVGRTCAKRPSGQ